MAMKIKSVCNAGGALFFVLGLSGMAGACEGQGSFAIGAIVFSIGFGMSLIGFKN